MFGKYGDEIRIVNVDALTYAGNLENLKTVADRKNYRFVKADIRDAAAINKIFDEEDVDYVVNFAAESHVDRSIENPGIFVSIVVFIPPNVGLTPTFVMLFRLIPSVVM